MTLLTIRYISGAAFGITEAVLIYWIIFLDKNTGLNSQSVNRADHVEENEKSGAALFQGKWMRMIVVSLCTVLATLSGYSVSDTLSFFDIVKVLAALLGISACMIVDLYTLLIPNRYILFMAMIRVAILPFELMLQESNVRLVIINSLIGAIGSFLLLMLLSLLSRGGIGMGDIKLLTVTGFLCGFYLVMNTMVYAVIVCALAALYLVITGKLTIKMKIPFGPFVYLGFIISTVLGAF